MRILLAGVLAGIAMFVWTSIAHMALPLGEAGINEIPNESAVLSAMQSSIGDNAGLYIFPHPGARYAAYPQRGRGKLTNARVDGHIHADGLICHYCERLRRRADMAAPAVVAIQNVISWRQSDPIFSILVCCHVRDFCLLSGLKMTSG